MCYAIFDHSSKNDMKSTITLCLAFLFLTVNAQESKKLSNESIWYSATFSSDYVGGLNSMNDGEHYTVLEMEDGKQLINKYAYKDGSKVATLLSNAALIPAKGQEPITISSYSFNADETKIVIATDEESIYRRSRQAYFYVYDMKGKRFRPLTDHLKGKQRLATISPDGNRAAFMRNNNLFMVDLSSMEETQITFDGVNNRIINGGTDWVYEEEFALTKGFEWSPNSDQIAYLRFDETQVREFSMPMYKGSLYPQEYRYKYPKAGETNSEVELHVYHLQGAIDEKIPVSNEAEYYIPRFGWTNENDVLWFMTMNRLQNTKTIKTVELAALRQVQTPLRPKTIYNEESDTYIEVTDDLHFLKNGKGFVLTSTSSGFNHIYSYNMSGKPMGQLTEGSWDVIEIIGLDEKRKRVIYASAESSPIEQEIWSIGLNGKGKRLISQKGGWNDAEFSSTYNYFINSHSTANDPGTITLNGPYGQEIKVLKDNSGLKKNLAEYNIQPIEFMKIDAGTHELNAWMIKPLGFESRKKYPVLMTIYGGPGHNTVTDSWGGRSGLWHQMLAQEGYIVVSVDPRGTERRGSEFKHATYGQMGKLETEDMITTAKWLKQQPWVDGERIGVQGWSYGGYMSSLCLMKGNDHFKSAIAVAPVTNWRYYDTIYTERYMGLPQDNPEGYDDNSPINYVTELEGPYLLVHGTGDDNVHWQNSAEMINTLVRENKEFDLHIYPDRNHGIYGGTTRMHLFNKMTSFLKENL